MADSSTTLESSTPKTKAQSLTKPTRSTTAIVKLDQATMVALANHYNSILEHKYILIGKIKKKSN